MSCEKGKCCRITSAVLLFLLFALVGAAAFDFGMLFLEWKRGVTYITALQEYEQAAFEEVKYEVLPISDLVTRIPIGVSIVGAKTMASKQDALCQFSTPLDANVFVKQMQSDSQYYTSMNDLGMVFLRECFTPAVTFYNTVFLYTSFVLCSVLWITALAIPICIFVCNKNRTFKYSKLQASLV